MLEHSYRLVMGYGHLLDTTYLDVAALEVNQKGLQAIFIKYGWTTNT